MTNENEYHNVSFDVLKSMLEIHVKRKDMYFNRLQATIKCQDILEQNSEHNCVDLLESLYKRYLSCFDHSVDRIKALKKRIQEEEREALSHGE